MLWQYAYLSSGAQCSDNNGSRSRRRRLSWVVRILQQRRQRRSAARELADAERVPPLPKGWAPTGVSRRSLVALSATQTVALKSRIPSDDNWGMTQNSGLKTNNTIINWKRYPPINFNRDDTSNLFEFTTAESILCTLSFFFCFCFSLIKTASDRMCGNDDFSTSFTYTVNHKCLQQIKRRRNHLFNDFHWGLKCSFLGLDDRTAVGQSGTWIDPPGDEPYPPT